MVGWSSSVSDLGPHRHSLTWGDVDLDVGAVKLDENKSRDPRAWRLGPGVGAALAWWKSTRKDNKTADAIFVGERSKPLVKARADLFREHLTSAKVDRAELYERSDVRQPTRLHDLRATFVTLSLATGRTET